MSGKRLTRSVYLEGQLLTEGTEVTDEQAEKLTNPKLFAEAADATGPDANDTREFYQAVKSEGTDAALRGDGAEKDTDDRAAAGAKLARSGKAAAPKATN